MLGAPSPMPSTPMQLPRGSAPTTPRGGDALVSSARRMLKPEVGMSAVVSALGSLPPHWDMSRPALAVATNNIELTPRGGGALPYNVGKTRARNQLKYAWATQDEPAQLRRLEQALRSCRYDGGVRCSVEGAAQQAGELARRLDHGGLRPPSRFSAEHEPPARRGGGTDGAVMAEVAPRSDEQATVFSPNPAEEVECGANQATQEDEIANDHIRIFHSEVDPQCTLTLKGGNEGDMTYHDQDAPELLAGTYALRITEPGLGEVELVFSDGTQCVTTLNLQLKTYANFLE